MDIEHYANSAMSRAVLHLWRRENYAKCEISMSHGNIQANNVIRFKSLRIATPITLCARITETACNNRWSDFLVCDDLRRFTCHDDVIKWKHFPRYWPFVQGIHRSPVNSPHKGQWRGTDVFFNICVNKRFSKQPRGCWFDTPSLIITS